MNGQQEWIQPPLPPPGTRPPGSGGGTVATVIVLGMTAVAALFVCSGVGMAALYVVMEQDESRYEYEMGSTTYSSPSGDVKDSGYYSKDSGYSPSGYYGDKVSEIPTEYAPSNDIPDPSPFAEKMPERDPFEIPAPPAPSDLPTLPEARGVGFVGKWRPTHLNQTYTIELVEGQPRITSVVQDNGEDYPVEFSAFDGEKMYWKYRVPGSEYKLEEVFQVSGFNELSGSYVSIPPDGPPNDQRTVTATRVID